MFHIPLLLAALATQATSFDTDTTVSVPQGSRLRLQNQGGDIVIKAWERSQMRIQANHSSRSYVEVDIRGQVVQLNTAGRRGFQAMVDYQLTVPSWMALEIGGMYAEISIEGTRASVKANTLEGNILLRGGSETIELTTLNGRIDVRGARGRVQLNNTSGDVAVSDVQGDLVVEAVSGDVDLRRIDARSVDVQSISGDLLYEGRIVDAGSYAFFTHSGDVTLALPDATNATINLASANGEMSSSFTVHTERETRRRHVYRLGSGSATIDVETFSGDLHLIRPSELRARREQPERPNERPKSRPERPESNDDHDQAQEN